MSMIRRIISLFRLTFSSNDFEIEAYIFFFYLLTCFWNSLPYWLILGGFEIPLFKPMTFFQSINPNPVKTFLSVCEPKAKQLIQNPPSLWFEYSSQGNCSSHLAEYLLPSVPRKIVPRNDGLISNSSVVLSLSNKDLPEKYQLRIVRVNTFASNFFGFWFYRKIEDFTFV